tara:strand:+ start:1707 stop:2948 length:1242 start_codon:yes stop_codon:yes gene_type:complete
MNSNFLGAMIWFTGVVEDIQDPQQLGRVRVRCYGYHTANKNQLPTEDLPWSIPITPVTSASVSGIGESATGLLPGSWVVGFFRDGNTAQDPVVLGSIPSTSFTERNEDENIGFSDPDKKTPRKPGTPDIPQMATVRYDQSDFYINKKSLREEQIPLSTKPVLDTIESGEDIIQFEQNPERQTWSSIDIDATTKPVYPYNHVQEYGAGHIFEVDETKSRERITRTHKTGTYDEYTADGSRTLMVKGHDYKVIFKDEKVYIKGACNLTIDQDCNTFIKGDYNLEVEKDFNVRVGGSLKRKIQGNKLTEVKGDQNINISGNELFSVTGNEIKTIKGGDGTLKIVKNGDLVEDVQRGSSYHMVKTNVNVEADGNSSNLIKGSLVQKSDGNMTLETSGAMNGEAAGSITFNGSTIHLN